MWRGAAFTCLLLGLSLAGCGKKAAAEFKIPPEEAARVNPVQATAESIAEGGASYLKFDCEVCHGKNGSGKGFMAGASSYNCRDWRDPNALKAFTDGELFYIINKGKGKGNMPGYEHRLGPQDAWAMINYIHSLAKQTP